MTLCRILATIDGQTKELGPWKYCPSTNDKIQQVLKAVKEGKTSSQKGVPAPDARLVIDVET